MARFEIDGDALRLGEALADLRRSRGLSQAEAGARLGMTSQGWGLYETGKRPGLFRPDVQRRLTGALDATPEALALAAGPRPASASPPSVALESPGRSFRNPPGLTRRHQLSDDDLAPWAMSGTIVEYEPGRWPRRDQGCVIETDAGLLVRLYVGADENGIVVRRGPDLTVEERIDRAAARAVSAIVARLER